MTPALLRSTARRYAGAPSTHPRLDDTALDGFFYDAQVEMVRGALMRGIYPVNLRRSTPFNLAAGTAVYYPADFVGIIRVRVKDSNGAWTTLQRATQEQLDELHPTWEDTTPNPSYDGPAWYYEAGEEDDTGDADFGLRGIGLFPAPTAALTGGGLLRYIGKPVSLATLASASKSLIYIPEEFHDALCQRCAARFLSENMEDPRPELAQGYMQYWSMSVQTYVARMGEQNQPDANGTSMAPPIAMASDAFWGSY